MRAGACHHHEFGVELNALHRRRMVTGQCADFGSGLSVPDVYFTIRRPCNRRSFIGDHGLVRSEGGPEVGAGAS